MEMKQNQTFFHGTYSNLTPYLSIIVIIISIIIIAIIIIIIIIIIINLIWLHKFTMVLKPKRKTKK